MKKFKTVIIIVAIVLLAIMLFPSKNTATNNTSPTPSSLIETTESVEAIYPSDEVVNDFIVSYNSISSSPITDTKQGNIKQKCYGKTYDHSIEILNGADKAIHVSVFASYDHPDMMELRDAFRDVLLTLDPSLTDEEVYKAFDMAANNPSARTDMVLGNVAYNCFWTVEHSDGSRSFGRIETSLPK